MVHTYPATPRLKLVELAARHAPAPLVRMARERGNAYFTAGIDLDEARPYLPTLPKGLHYSAESGVLLKVRNVHPHNDDAVGRLSECWTGTVFGLLKAPALCHLQVGDEYVKMRSGDWVIFDDNVLHSLMTDRLCLGVSFQIGTAARDPSDDFGDPVQPLSA